MELQELVEKSTPYQSPQKAHGPRNFTVQLKLSPMLVLPRMISPWAWYQ